MTFRGIQGHNNAFYSNNGFQMRVSQDLTSGTRCHMGPPQENKSLLKESKTFSSCSELKNCLQKWCDETQKNISNGNDWHSATLSEESNVFSSPLY